MNPKHDKVHHTFVLLLASLAGCIDAISFVNAGVFPANMTGNSVVLAISVVNHAAASQRETHAFLIILGFCFGSAIAALLIRSQRMVWSRSVNLVFMIAGCALLGAGVAMGNGKIIYSSGILLALAAAMGMQASALLHLNFPGAGTSTAVTGTLATGVTRAVQHLWGIMVPGFVTDQPSPWFPLMVFSVYFIGALAGGVQRGFHASVATMVCGGLLALVGLAEEFRTSRNQSRC